MRSAWEVANVVATATTAVLALLDEERASRWRSLLAGRIPTEQIRAADHYVLFSYVNIIFAEYQFARRKLINRDYALESVADNVKQLVPSGEFIIPLLRFTGYDNEFVDLVQRVAERGDEGAAEWIRTRRYRCAWRARSRSQATAAAGSSAE